MGRYKKKDSFLDVISKYCIYISIYDEIEIVLQNYILWGKILFTKLIFILTLIIILFFFIVSS